MMDFDCDRRLSVSGQRADVDGDLVIGPVDAARALGEIGRVDDQRIGKCDIQSHLGRICRT